MTGNTIEAIINPLAFLEVDEPWAGLRNEPVTTDHILKFLSTPGIPNAIEDFLERYRKVSVEEPRLFAAPAEARLMERLIWPLRQAKGSYMLGNYLGTISLAGMVGEMAAILIFDLGDVRLNNEPINEEKQKSLFGSTFEKLNQDRRTRLLKAYGLIDNSINQAFETIRLKRKRYLHLWSANHASLEADAVECFKAAVLIVVSALGLSVKDGKIILRQEVYNYLSAHNAGPEPVEPSNG